MTTNNPHHNFFEAAGDTADAPFSGPYSYKPAATTDKSGAKHTEMSRARHLARVAMKKAGDRVEKDKKEVKEARLTAYDKINQRYKNLSGRSLEQSAKHYDDLTKKIEQQKKDWDAYLASKRSVKEDVEGICPECENDPCICDDGFVTETTGVTNYNPKSHGGTRKELLAKYHKSKDPKDAEAARRAGATQKELQGVAEGLVKDIKRLVTGKDVNSRARQEITKAQQASMTGDNKTSSKHFKRYDKLDKLANKEQGVAEEVESIDEAQYGVNLGSRPVSGQKEYQGKEIKSFHPNKEQEAREYAKKHGYIVKKKELPKGNNITHTWDIHKEEVESIDEISSELAMKVSGERFKKAMSMDAKDPNTLSAFDKFRKSSEAAKKRIHKELMNDPIKANKSYASGAEDDRKRGLSTESVVTEENDTTEKIEMTQSQLHFIKYACEEILEYIEKGGEVEEWYQVKIAKSFSEFESLHSFMEGESRRTGMKEEVEPVSESHFKVGDKVKCKASKMTGVVVKLDKQHGGDDEKYYSVKRVDGRVTKYAPSDLEKLNESWGTVDTVSK